MGKDHRFSQGSSWDEPINHPFLQKDEKPWSSCPLDTTLDDLGLRPMMRKTGGQRDVAAAGITSTSRSTDQSSHTTTDSPL
jgi:hypothetical protein